MKRRVTLVLLLVLPLALLWSYQSHSPDSTHENAVIASPGAEAGLKIHIDPVTKQPVETPIQPSLDIPSMDDDLNFSSEGLTIEKSPVSGEMVDLQGRFRHRYDASVGANGELKAHCDLHKSTKDKDTDSEEE